jgi:DNA-binding NarL/FixJ family response regulator
MSEKENAQLEPIRILLVEDHKLTRVSLKMVLKRQSDLVVVGEAENGEEAIAMAEKLQPDIILMDVGMPVMDGIQASRKIIEKGSTGKIIMLTQHDNDQDILASLTAGASGYCLKDVEPERLYMAIRTVHVGDAWLDSAIAGKVLRNYLKEPAVGSENQAGDPHEEMTPAGEKIDKVEKKNFEPDRPYAEPLSPRELEVLTLIVDGLSNQEISDKLIISLPTTKTHVRNILNKLAVNDRTQAAVHAMRRGIV